MSRVKLYLTGVFRVERADGADLTPRGAKECALLALLARSQSGERARAWLQATLWSDRAKDQAAASLRQAVLQIRRALGDEQDILTSAFRSIGLRLEAVNIVSDPRFEFLEGMDVRDQAFESWLTVERSAFELETAGLQAGHTPRTALHAKRAWPENGPDCIMLQAAGNLSATHWGQERALADVTRIALADMFSGPVVEQEFGQFGPNVWQVSLSCLPGTSGGGALRISLNDAATHHVFWSRNVDLPTGNVDPTNAIAALALIRELCSALQDQLAASIGVGITSENANILAGQATKKLFSMRADEVGKADRLFAQAFDCDPRGLYLAYRALVREVQFIERLGDDNELLQEECAALARRAMELEPRNATVLSVLSITRLHLAEDVHAAFEYAARAIRSDRTNPMAWWAQGAAQVAAGDPVRAFESATVAARLAEGSPLEFWAKSQLSGAAIAMRKLGFAKSVFNNVSFNRPSFRPPLRYLLALHATDEEWDIAMDIARRLEKIEPDFSIDRMLSDDTYPSILLRKPYGLSKDRLRSIV